MSRGTWILVADEFDRRANAWGRDWVVLGVDESQKRGGAKATDIGLWPPHNIILARTE